MGTGASWRNQIPADAPVALAEEVRELRRRLRRTQRELRAVRARYRLLYQRGPAANFVIGRRGTILDVDEKSARSLGYAADALIGRDVLELTPPRRRKALAGALKRAFGGVPSGRLEVEFLGRRGPKRFLLPEGYLPLKQNGRVEAVLGSGIDVTDWGDGRLTLRRLLRDQHRFERRLTALQEVVNELSTTDTVEQLCRRAIQLGRRRLGFDRLGLWFLTDEPNVVRGCFGTDVRGRVRDIRGVVGPVDPDSLMGRILNARISLGVAEDEDLLSAEGEVVGRGTLVIASLWDGQKITGCLCADNLLRGEPFSPQQCELLRLYASALAYGCSRKRAEEALSFSEERYRTLVDQASDAFFLADPDGGIVEVNTSFCRMLGYSIQELKKMNVSALVSKPDQESEIPILREFRRRRTVVFDRRFRRKDGSEIVVEIGGKRLTNGYLQGIMRDVTQRKLDEAKLRQAAIYDATTGLFNRKHFLERFATEFRLAQKNGSEFSICLCDLDDFKSVNDRFGHLAGDEVLVALGRMISEEIRLKDIAGRYGGDEFCIIFPNTPASEAILSVERIRARLAQKIFHAGGKKNFSIHATFGLADLAAYHADEKGLFDSTDKALYQAKALGGNWTVIFPSTEKEGAGN